MHLSSTASPKSTPRPFCFRGALKRHSMPLGRLFATCRGWLAASGGHRPSERVDAVRRSSRSRLSVPAAGRRARRERRAVSRRERRIEGEWASGSWQDNGIVEEAEPSSQCLLHPLPLQMAFRIIFAVTDRGTCELTVYFIPNKSLYGWVVFTAFGSARPFRSRYVRWTSRPSLRMLTATQPPIPAARSAGWTSGGVPTASGLRNRPFPMRFGRAGCSRPVSRLRL